MALWHVPCGRTTGWIKIMAQINIPRLPAAQEEYSQEQINQIIQTLDQLILLLNFSYTPEQLKNEDEALTWYLN
jgi:hypothetical protein